MVENILMADFYVKEKLKLMIQFDKYPDLISKFDES